MFTSFSFFFKFLLRLENELHLCQKCKTNWGSMTVSEIKRVEIYTDFDKWAHIIQYGLQGFIVNNIKGESTEANDLRHILYRWVCYVNNPKFCQRFHKT